jgi:hypothetical protein
MAILGKQFWWGRLGGFTSRLPAQPAALNHADNGNEDFQGTND